MDLLAFLRRKRPGPIDLEIPSFSLYGEITARGLVYRTGLPAVADARTVRLDTPGARPLLSQLVDDGYATEEDGAIVLTWDAVYERTESGVGGWDPAAIGCPTVRPIRPALISRGSLTDADFVIGISGWRDDAGQLVAPSQSVGAAVGWQDGLWLMPAPVWRLVERIRAFSTRMQDGREPESQRRAWGEIRRLAVQSNAVLDDFLTRSVVVTADRLDVGFRTAQVAESKLVEVIPSVRNVPNTWLEKFDRLPTVPARYDLPTSDGIIQVIVSPEVRTVLEEIKRMPGRRVTGERAERFLTNPIAALGPDAATAVDAEQIEQAKADAGIESTTFLARVDRDANGSITAIGLDLVRCLPGREPIPDALEFVKDQDVVRFVEGARKRIDCGLQYFGWEGHDLEIVEGTTEQLAVLDRAIEERHIGQILIRAQDVYDLSHYSERIDGVGEEERIYSPFIARKDENAGWFPENVVPLIQYDPRDGGDPVQIAVTTRLRENLHAAVREAAASGATEVTVHGLPRPMPIPVAQGLIESFERADADIRKGRPPRGDDAGGEPKPVRRRVGLKLKTNVDGLEYEERRALLIGDGNDTPILPRSLRATVALKPHQKEGVARLQRLYEHSPTQCRGALLADDMGLGKTLQLLTFLAAAFEHDPAMPPALIVAPVSLLENWVEETQRFFEDGTLPILTVYGQTLTGLKADRHSIDVSLRQDGLVKFLKPGWRGTARLVLTTYETLRDLEFSFAAERWSVFVCDESQKIKNPAAAVTRAAKKQHARFKIACTGTPVENTLTDLWCLFDFVQPGLLGSLNDFGRRYRKPIEAKTDSERQQVEDLRRLIEPQVIRRTKKQVARDLPAKVVAGNTRVRLSDHQHALYAWALGEFRGVNAGMPAQERRFKNHLGVLHFLRMVCADPRTGSEHGLRLDPFEHYSRQSPKLGWLIAQLKEIERRAEKVLVFCEFRDVQQMLAHYIAVNFGVLPDIINGDAPTASKADTSRQARLRVFQEKSGFGVIILSPLAVGFGVNIQAANHVIHFTRTWNPAKEDQATDRAYRIGQTRDVTVYYPTVWADDFDTFEVKLDRLLAEKRELADDMLNGAGDVKAEDLI